MDWINKYQLFMFDFDGLLVNTEKYHYDAYRLMCEKRGVSADITFSEYCLIAHYEHDGLQKGFYKRYPKLFEQEPDWSILYAEKKQCYIDLIHNNPIGLMPGVHKLLEALNSSEINRCVVTHSPLEQIDKIRHDNPILKTIPHWITRESYSHPKPHPECYLKAMELLSKSSDKVIGFEDTPRGLKALLGTTAKAIFVTQVPYPDQKTFVDQGARLVGSLEELIAI